MKEDWLAAMATLLAGVFFQTTVGLFKEKIKPKPLANSVFQVGLFIVHCVPMGESCFLLRILPVCLQSRGFSVFYKCS